MSFICVICRDLLKITEDFSSHEHLSANTTPKRNLQPSSTGGNNVSGRKKEKNNSIVATKCGHLFHYPCLSVWLSQSVNLTTDSKMRCPSCKQLIYIYEIVQLFPVEGNYYGCDNDSIFSTGFQSKMKYLLERIENAVEDLGKNVGRGPTKGNETPTRFQRIMESPKKNGTQLAELLKEFDSLRISLKELSSALEHAELGNVVEKQEKEISELKSKNEMLTRENERLKLETVGSGEEGSINTLPLKTKNTELTNNLSSLSSETDSQDINQSTENSSIISTPPKGMERIKTSNGKDNRRKSVTFLDPFDDEDDKAEFSTNLKDQIIPFHTKDLRVGDKVIWYFEGNPEVGTVKWKGFIGSEINVGVEFERQLGLPIKDLSSDAIQCIFKSKPGHGRLIPVNEIYTYDKKFFTDDKLITINYDPSECVQNECKNSNFIRRLPLCTQQ